MKHNNKFIAVGIGLALSFSATNIGYMWFTDSNTLNDNSISFGSLYDKYIASNAEIDDINGRDKKELDIKLPDELKKIDDLTIIKATGRFSSYKTIENDDGEIEIKFGSSLSNSDIEYDGEYITIEFKLKVSSKPDKYEKRRYQIKFVKGEGERKLIAHWYLIQTTPISIKLEEDSERIEDGSIADQEIPGTSNPDIPNQEENTPPESGDSSTPDTENPSSEEGSNLEDNKEEIESTTTNLDEITQENNPDQITK